MGFYWSLSNCKSPQVSKILLSILANVKNALVWIVSTCSLISKSSSPFPSPFEIVPYAPITIGKTVNFIFHSLFLLFWLDLGTYISFRFLLILLYGLTRTQSPPFSRLFFLSLGLVFWSRIADLFISQNLKDVCTSHSQWQILGWALYTGLYGQISFSSTISCRSRSPPSRVKFYPLFALICWIRLLCDWSFRLYHHITHICYFVAFYLLLL